MVLQGLNVDRQDKVVVADVEYHSLLVSPGRTERSLPTSGTEDKMLLSRAEQSKEPNLISHMWTMQPKGLDFQAEVVEVGDVGSRLVVDVCELGWSGQVRLDRRLKAQARLKEHTHHTEPRATRTN